MKIEIKYPAFVTDRQNEQVESVVSFASVLEKLKSGANIAKYLSSEFEDHGIVSGKIRLKVDSKANSLFSIVCYEVDESLPKNLLQKLVDETTGQLSDGYGENPWEFKEKGSVFFVSLIDLFSGKNIPASVSTIGKPSIIKKVRRSPIFSAIESGDLEKARKHLNIASLHSTEKWGFTPLMLAIRDSHRELALEMIELGSNVNHMAKASGATPLSVAAMNGDSVVGQTLIEYGADVNSSEDDPDDLHSGNTPLMWAANRENVEFVKLLLNSGADVNLSNQNNQTALMFVNGGRPKQNEIFELLLQKKPLLDVKDFRGRTIIDDAKARSNNSSKHEMMNLIIKYYPDLELDWAP